MRTVYNIRGTNGSGKTTVASCFLPPDYQRLCPVDLSTYESPTKRDPARTLRYPGYGSGRVAVLGKYDEGCGGMDRHPAGKGFSVPIAAIDYILNREEFSSVESIICEGVLASGVYGSWHEYARQLEAHGRAQFAFVYMSTPLEVCLERIQSRRVAAGSAPKQGADWDRMVKNVKDKFEGTAATRLKALADGHLVYDLPFDNPFSAMVAIVTNGGPGSEAAEVYRARA